MPTHAERRRLPYRAADIFDLVADVERYPEFLPWCVGVSVLRREERVLLAEMLIGFKLLRERFTSRVTLCPPERIDVVYIDGPFRRLDNHWIFKSAEDGCTVDFHIDFEFRSPLLRRLMGPLFNEAVRRMVAAFEARARLRYGRPPGPGEAAPAPLRALRK